MQDDLNDGISNCVCALAFASQIIGMMSGKVGLCFGDLQVHGSFVTLARSFPHAAERLSFYVSEQNSNVICSKSDAVQTLAPHKLSPSPRQAPHNFRSMFAATGSSWPPQTRMSLSLIGRPGKVRLLVHYPMEQPLPLQLGGGDVLEAQTFMVRFQLRNKPLYQDFVASVGHDGCV
jgi:hypothetical protein